MALVAFAGEGRRQDGTPKASDLFEATKVWTLHLRFTAERWAATEPEGGTNPFDKSALGLGLTRSHQMSPTVNPSGKGSSSSRTYWQKPVIQARPLMVGTAAG